MFATTSFVSTLKACASVSIVTASSGHSTPFISLISSEVYIFCLSCCSASAASELDASEAADLAFAVSELLLVDVSLIIIASALSETHATDAPLLGRSSDREACMNRVTSSFLVAESTCHPVRALPSVTFSADTESLSFPCSRIMLKSTEFEFEGI